MYMYIYIYIYTYGILGADIHLDLARGDLLVGACARQCMFDSCAANLRTKTLDFRRFDSSIILTLRVEIIMSIRNPPEILSQRMFAGIILVRRCGREP